MPDFPFTRLVKKGMHIGTGVDVNHNDLRGQVDTVNSVTFVAWGAALIGTALHAGIALHTQLANRSAVCDAASRTESAKQPQGGVAAPQYSESTQYMGIIAGGWGNGDTRGIAGLVGPSGDGVLSCNVFGKNDFAEVTDIIKCLIHAVERDAHWVVTQGISVRIAVLAACAPRVDSPAAAHSLRHAIQRVLQWTDTNAPYKWQMTRDAFAKICDRDGIVVVSAGDGVYKEYLGREYVGVDVANSGWDEWSDQYEPNKVRTSAIPAYARDAR